MFSTLKWMGMSEVRRNSKVGKWVVAGLILVSLLLAILRWMIVPKSNPRLSDPGSPFYSRPKPEEVPSSPAERK